ncbi:MAG TPA: pseudouridine synthase [Arenimonas sp.]|nr:pseudouridine synthase [Arenimonas sp.]HPO24963.1 pseudouridine synthase [Arenimonas sp.]HPW33038.1 pseudouridine synthase [Arenimonas sp.]
MLPTRDGVGPSVITLPAGDWLLVIDFLMQRFDSVPREEWLARMQNDLVMDENGDVVYPDRPYQAHLKIFYYRSIENETPIPFEESILFQDEHLIIADKPHFLPVMPAGTYLQETLLVRLKRKTGIETLVPMHRIDRETAGLVVFVIKPETRGAYQSLFLSKQVDKCYQAVAPYRDDLIFPMTYKSRLQESGNFMQMEVVEGEANSETFIEVMERRDNLARYRLKPITGKKHQLRAHMATLGIPILNDLIYPVHRAADQDDFEKPLQLLAQRIAFVDPVTEEERSFETKLKLFALP